jgi:hypothetical protein
VHRLARIRQPQREQVALHRLTSQPHPHIGEVHLGFGARLVRLRHHPLRLHPALLGLGGDLRAALVHIVTNRRIAGLVKAMLGQQPVINPLDRVPLFARGRQILPQHRIDPAHRRLDHQRPGLGRLLARRRHRRLQRHSHRAAVHAMTARQLPHRHIRLQPAIPADALEQLHARQHQRPPDTTDR